MAKGLKALAREFGMGRLLYRLYHAPIGQAKQVMLEGGPLEQRRTEAGRQQMVEAAKHLPPLAMPEGEERLRIHFLTGAKYWYQTLFCFYSLQITVPGRVGLVICDDGTLTDESRGHILRVAPWAVFIPYSEIEACLDRSLPASRFPTLRARRLEYPYLRKLTDVHVEAGGWTLVLDSDMLFFKRPDALLEWARAPRTPCYIVEGASAYYYSDALMQELAGGPVPEAVNAGLYGFHSPSIDWDRLEAWCRTQLERRGPHYLQEQALTALLMAGQDGLALPKDEYVVKPSLREGRNPTRTLHHYVAESKRSFFQHGWQRIFALSADRAPKVTGASADGLRKPVEAFSAETSASA